MIYVCSLREMPRHVRSLRPAYLVSLVQQEFQPRTPAKIEAESHHRVVVDDVSAPGLGAVVPEEVHVREMVTFLARRSRDESLLIHCYAGISRSTAAALIALSLDMDGREVEAAQTLRREAPHAQPNRRIIVLADQILDRQGRLVAARDAMGRAKPAHEGPLVALDPTPL